MAFVIYCASSSGVRNYIKDLITFSISFVSNPSKVGAIAPSSPFLGQEIIKYIKNVKSPIRILEVGAGTGAFTEQIINELKEEDHLDAVELDCDFCNILTGKFGNHKNVYIHCASILEWKTQEPYDFIISGLPFNAFDADFVQSILKKYEKLIKPDGMISYFEYIALADIKKFFLQDKEKAEFSKTLTTTESFRGKFEFETSKVWFNIPPAYVHHLKIEK